MIWRSYLISHWSYYPFHPVEFIWDLYREIRAFIYRGLNGYASCDLWSFDDYLSRVISKGLKEFKQTMHSHPCELTFGEWTVILNKIIYAFELDIKEDNELPYELTEKDKIKREEGKQLFIKWYPNLWD